MRSKPQELKIPSSESVGKYLNGEKADAETAAFGRKVEQFYAQYVAKHKGSKLRKLLEKDLAAGDSRKQALESAIKAGYLETYADGLLSEILCEGGGEPPMELVKLLAFAESLCGPDAPEVLHDAYFLGEAWNAAERWLEAKRTKLPRRIARKPPARNGSGR